MGKLAWRLRPKEAGMTGKGRHRILIRIAALVICSLALLALTSVPTTAQAVWGTSTVEVPEAPGLEGYWLYQLNIEWDTTGLGGYGMSHISFFLELGVCDCACDGGIVTFDGIAGTGVGVDGCELEFLGLYECTGDPSFPGNVPTIKYEYVESECEPDEMGAATLFFYSRFGPGDPCVHAGSLGIKAATVTEVGDLTGVLPLCECGSPVEQSTWGMMKSLYR
jgi:hypothetical protein